MVIGILNAVSDHSGCWMTKSPNEFLFTQQQWQQIEQLTQSLDSTQRTWLSGYLLQQRQQNQLARKSELFDHVLVAYGTETGNCEILAQQFTKRANANGIKALAKDLANLRLRELKKVNHLLVICSTHGDGDPPESIQPFYDALHSKRAFELSHLNFSVLALGDSSYEHFCLTGKQLDQRLEALQANRLFKRVDCDVNFDAESEDWSTSIIELLLEKGLAVSEPLPSQLRFQSTRSSTQQSIDKRNPVAVDVLENTCLSATPDGLSTHHIVLNAEGLDFDLRPGDAVGVLPENPPELSAEILDLTGLSGNQLVTMNGISIPLVQALRDYRDLVVVSKGFLRIWSSFTKDEELIALLESDSRILRDYLKNNQLVDLLVQFPAMPDPQSFVDALRPLQPRLYDLANSFTDNPDEIHLTVKRYRYEFSGRLEKGIASAFLSDLSVEESVRIYPHRNKRFHFSEDPKTPLIFVAESTGIAPFRSHIQSLNSKGIQQPVWLLFEEKSFERDFSYQLELQAFKQADCIQYVDTNFTEDQPYRSLLDPMMHNQKRLLEWMDNGARMYLCGNKKKLTDLEKQITLKMKQKASWQRTWDQMKRDNRIHRNLY